MTVLTAPPPASTAADLVATIGLHAEQRGHELALRFLRRGEHVDEEASYAELDKAARTIARNLAAAGLAGRPVLVALPQGIDFVRCFLGCLHAGVIAIPTPALGDPRGADRLLRIAAHAQPAALVAPLDRHDTAHWTALRERAPSCRFLAIGDLLAGEAGERTAPRASGDVAFLQYTSGSTSQPKAVVITHGNIAANLAMIRTAFAQDASNSTVSWLPLHHDMGLIGCVLEPLVIGASATLMSPLAFLQRPLRWLRAMDRFGATTAGAPNFAYGLCARSIDAAEASTLDLSRWSLAFCGAEPVRADTLARFSAHFAGSGFSAKAFYPCYGLAEATLFVTGGVPGQGVATAALPRQGGGIADVVSCGTPRLGTSIAVLRSDGAAHVACGETGEIAVSGDQVSPGFWNSDGRVAPDPEREVVIDGRRYLRTGDLGALRDGALHVLGRLKNMIIVRGVNIYAEDVEQTVLTHPAAAAFEAAVALSILDRADGEGEVEGFVLVCELSRKGETVAASALQALTQAVAEVHGIMLLAVLVVPYGDIERTVSGKLQRPATRSSLQEGRLTALQHHTPGRGGIAVQHARDRS
ncbi:fatty acyl-AMP ligase [Ancylobacter sonchi]|uniref:fatty acyl-AMP ligase n=1 Tax=Ancylobacter sonchi TaxID=1937790 RepID=UPI001BD4D59E|nr:fatty acyl-AMP ligase [Ancylobacter sonchi]MBS7534940.1 fatty acyl-AMP ligase [Ancylobacter sonchi]